MEQQEQNRDFSHSFGHQTCGYREGSFEPCDVGADKRAGKLTRQSTPANPNAWVKSTSHSKSNKVSVVTASDTNNEMVADYTDARKRRPRITRKNPLMASSSNPIREEEFEDAYAQDNLDLGPRPH